VKILQPQKLAVVIAHPDDEAFGPGGTIAHYAREGVKVHLICVTNGDASADKSLGATRREELTESSDILGVSSLRFLDFVDGSLNNNLYHAVRTRLKMELDTIKPDTLMTFDLSGVSGHLDHIAVASVTSQLYESLSYVLTIMYFCETEGFKKMLGDYFVYVPEGYPPEQIDLTLDISSVYPTKLQAMKAHHSQAHDLKWILEKEKNRLKQENFRIKSKKS
jgi:LmbE family N-acetylglucosaminyl deacetylase